MNKYSIVGTKSVNNLKHILKIMRITSFFFFMSVLFSHATTSYSQGAELSLDIKSATIKEIGIGV